MRKTTHLSDEPKIQYFVNKLPQYTKCQTNVRHIIWCIKDFLRTFAPDLVIFKTIL